MREKRTEEKTKNGKRKRTNRQKIRTPAGGIIGNEKEEYCNTDRLRKMLSRRNTCKKTIKHTEREKEVKINRKYREK